ncbi:uncharacterized protein LOC135199693 [Macrobrachium nipponense]|uniref:uncharacterized protein LOC135199693 n=1 Tax=Macrobrachium nipponense TaxID=159736 RepID=UPI0030C87F06
MASSPSSSLTKPSTSKTPMMTRRRTRSAGSSPDDNSPKIQRPRLHSPPQTNKQPLLPFPTMDSSDGYNTTQGNDDNEYQGYSSTKTPHTNENRGLITLVKATIPSEKVRNIDCGQGIEMLSIHIRLENTSLVIHNIYKGHDKILEGENLFSAASRENTFFAGDFNASSSMPYDPTTYKCSRQTTLHLLLEEFPEVALLNDTNEATHLRGGSLDLSFVSQNLKEECTWKGHPILTGDHFATDTSIKITKIPPPPPPPAGWRPDLANWPTFENQMTVWATQYLQTPAQNINTLQEDFVSSLHNAANISMPKKTFSTNQTPHKDSWYYNKRVKEMNTRVNRTRKLFRPNPTDEMHALLRDVINHATQTAKEVKQETWLKWCSQTTRLTSIAKMFKWFNKISGKSKITQPHHPDPQAEANRLTQHFADRTKSAHLPQTTRERQVALDPGRWRVINTACNIPDDTDTPFTLKELGKALQKGTDTAPGADMITYSMLKNMGTAAKTVHLHIINRTYTESSRPTQWNQQNTQPIPKPKEPNSYRPISLISCTEKTAERMVLNRLLWKTGPLHHRLYAYKEGICTQECLADVMSTINERKAIVVFLDLEKAYELASAAAILEALADKAVKGNLLAWAKGYMQNR